VFSNLFSITLPNIGKYFPGIHFSKRNYFPANKRALRVLISNKKDILIVLTTTYFDLPSN
jgi:hypothetical protein